MQPEEVEQFRSGERPGFERVFHLHAADVRRVVERFMKSAFEQDDALQDIWLSVWRQSAQYTPERGPIISWLKALAANRCRDLLRSRGREPVEYDEQADAPEPKAGPEEVAHQAELERALQQFAATLPADEAAALKAGVLSGVPHQELAATLGVTVRRSKYLKQKLLSRALAHPKLCEMVSA
jgi:RNA polymerase sigma-70 factor (ECF subfamily)